ncbi:MAG: hypothetical protein ACI9TV_002047 [Sulfurimonas sp.]|uniref:hypothetical protein n=1 Tax=Sulfurimonas sp. TaxID=2022749 RepID=UPI0039E2C950
MSIKNDIEMVKEELTSEEKFFEKSVITERFVKKYKNILIAGVVVVVVAIASNIAYDVNKASTQVAANETLSELKADPSNVAALTRLESLSPALHDVFIYSKALIDKDMKTLESLKSSDVAPLSDLATYELAQSTKDVNALTTYALNQDAIYKDLAQVQAAIILMNEGNIDKAHLKLQTILDTSPLAKVAKALLHYGVK